MIKVIFKFIFGFILYLVLLPTTPLAALIIPLITKVEVREDRKYKWGWIWGTFDNPIFGDDGFITKRAPYPGIITGWKGYINKVQWMRRNRLYNFKKWLGVDYTKNTEVILKGNPDISDKYKVPGWLFVRSYDKGKLTAFEWYSITPWSKKRNLRIRLGWKIKGRKFTEPGDFAQIVLTINPFDGYGNS